MSRLIYADAVLYALVEEGHDNATKYGFRLGDTIKFTPTQVDEIVSRMPTIEERKKGKWIIKYNPETGWYSVTCPECGEDVTSVIPMIGFFPNAKALWSFCPNCGMDMRGGQK